MGACNGHPKKGYKPADLSWLLGADARRHPQYPALPSSHGANLSARSHLEHMKPPVPGSRYGLSTLQVSMGPRPWFIWGVQSLTTCTAGWVCMLLCGEGGLVCHRCGIRQVWALTGCLQPSCNLSARGCRLPARPCVCESSRSQRRLWGCPAKAQQTPVPTGCFQWQHFRLSTSYGAKAHVEVEVPEFCQWLCSSQIYRAE